MAGSGGHFGGEQAHDQAVLVGRPHRSIPPQERSAGAFLTAERQRPIDEAFAEPFEPDRHFDELASELRRDAVDHAAGDDGLADGAVGTPARPVGAEIGNSGCEKVIRVHQPARRTDDAMPVGVRVIGEGDVEFVLQRDQPLHRIGRRTVHPDIAVPVHRHETECRIDGVVHDRCVNPVTLDQRLPILNSSAAERIDPDAHTRRADRFEIDDIGQIGNIRRDIIMGMNARRFPGAFIRNARNTIEFVFEKRVGGFPDPSGHVDICRSAVGGIVFEAAFVRRIVRGADDNAVGKARGPAAIVGKDRVRDHRGRGIAVVLVDHRLDAICCQNFNRGGECRFRQSMGVHAKKERPADAGLAAVKADGLGNRPDMRLVERRGEGRTTVPRRAERDALRGDCGIGRQREIGGHQPRDVDQE